MGTNPVKRHLRVEGFHRDAEYKSKKQVFNNGTPRRSDGQQHGAAISSQLRKVKDDYASMAQAWQGKEDITQHGITVEIQSAPTVDLDIKRLEDNGWQLLNEQKSSTETGDVTLQRWFVPDGKLDVLENLVQSYLTETTKVKGQPQPKYRPFIEAIDHVGRAAASQLWTEEDEPFPEDKVLWFEVWLRAGSTSGEREVILQQFRKRAAVVGFTIGASSIKLPEHTVVAVSGAGVGFIKDLALLNCISEIRRGRDYADRFDALPASAQMKHVNDLLARISLPKDGSAYVVVLDTGINRAHPLLENLLPEADNLTIKTEWTAADDGNHGTLMAGLCLLGDLAPLLESKEAVAVVSRIEGVKIVPPVSAQNDDEKLAGAYTAQGVALVEGRNAGRRRVWCIATTMKDSKNPTPTSWSSQLDALASGVDADGQVHRLICLSAGNVPQEQWGGYPGTNYKYSSENPAQSWNALCVGACTDLKLITSATGYEPRAPRGAIAPSSSTSLSWENRWPNKPDVVFEGGNAGFQKANNSTLELPELQLLSTYSDFATAPLSSLSGTSPAVALCSRFAAQILEAYPTLWPETVRGLIVHSAQWTSAMEHSVPADCQGDKRKRTNFLLRTAGYGIPNINRALECLNQRATLIAECEIQPFKEEKGEIVFNQLHIHRLPWPKTTLAEHSRETVRMRVTLSYFVEPNPGSRVSSHFRYPSCGLRFKVSSPGQDEKDLEADVNKLALAELESQERKPVAGTTDGWLIGQTCFRGSIHSDVWEGSAADLLSMANIAVYPVTGWWRTRPSHKKGNAKLKYSLVITLESANAELDVYTEIANLIETNIIVQT